MKRNKLFHNLILAQAAHANSRNVREEKRPEVFSHLYGDVTPTLRSLSAIEREQLKKTLEGMSFPLPIVSVEPEFLRRAMDDIALLPRVTTTDMEEHVLRVLKGHEVCSGNRFVLDSLCAITDIDRARLTGDPMFLPQFEDPRPVKSGFKLKPNATSMYQQFVERNHKR